MLFNLVKKDLILAKKYLIPTIIFAIVGPIFIYSKLGLSNGSFLSFLITLLFTEYILFNMIAISEDKYKGAALLCTTPYTRKSVIKAKYLLILIIFLGCFLLYNLATIIGASVGLERLSIFNAGTSLLIISLFFGVFIPVQIKFGYEKTRYISFILVFLTPFLLPVILQCIQSNNSTLDIHLFDLIPQGLKVWLPLVIAFVIFLLSMQGAIRIYSKKDL
jgi:hypothetical protein